MSLNNLALPAQLIADLYRTSLVQSSARPVPNQPPVPHLGDNKKNILVAVSHVDVPFLPDTELAFLTTVLSACGLGLADVAIINLASGMQQAPAAVAQLQPEKVILFNIPPEGFGLPADSAACTVILHSNKQYVVAPALAAIETDREAKRLLWASLKQLFCL